MRIVLDTNVLVSAFLFEKRLGKIAKLIEQGDITPCFLVYTLYELKTVLQYEKFAPVLKRINMTAEEIVEHLSNHSLVLADPKEIPQIVRHLGDNYVLAAGITVHADYIVTGDAELLEFKSFQNIPIVIPQKFLENF